MVLCTFFAVLNDCPYKYINKHFDLNLQKIQLLIHSWCKEYHMNIFGIGPMIVITGALSFAATVIIGSNMEHIGYWLVPREILTILGSAFVIVGLYFWLDAVRLIATRFKLGILILDGVYRFVRNPMYAGFIVFIVPGLSFILNNPLIMLSSIIMLLVFKMNIYKEEKYLQQRFGHAYEDYQSKVKQIIPFIW